MLRHFLGAGRWGVWWVLVNLAASEDPVAVAGTEPQLLRTSTRWWVQLEGGGPCSAHAAPSGLAWSLGCMCGRRNP